MAKHPSVVTYPFISAINIIFFLAHLQTYDTGPNGSQDQVKLLQPNSGQIIAGHTITGQTR